MTSVAPSVKGGLLPGHVFSWVVVIPVFSLGITTEMKRTGFLYWLFLTFLECRAKLLFLALPSSLNSWSQLLLRMRHSSGLSILCTRLRKSLVCSPGRNNIIQVRLVYAPMNLEKALNILWRRKEGKFIIKFKITKKHVYKRGWGIVGI